MIHSCIDSFIDASAPLESGSSMNGSLLVQLAAAPVRAGVYLGLAFFFVVSTYLYLVQLFKIMLVKLVSGTRMNAVKTNRSPFLRIDS